MKRTLFLLTALLVIFSLRAEFRPFCFVQMSDIHISPANDNALWDLRRSVREINTIDSVAFVIVSGDIADAGEAGSMRRAKQVLDSLRMPYYIIPGNHETKWSESGCTDFARVFGYERFAFAYNGCFFFGFNTGPVIKMADGHVSPQDIRWMRQLLDDQPEGTYIFPVTHYPLQTGDVDNWFEVTDVLRQYNVQAVLGGHYHRNILFNCDGIPDVLTRSNLRGKDTVGGYSIISVAADSVRWQEKVVGRAPVQWLALPFGRREYGEPDPALRPSFEVNKQYPAVRNRWQVQPGAAFYAAPVWSGRAVYIGDENGTFFCIDARNGRTRWTFQTGSRIISTACVAGGRVCFGSTDGGIYCLDARNGALCWKVQTPMAVMGCPVEKDGILYIGGSDGTFRAIRLSDGAEQWRFGGLKGYVETRPCIYNGKIYFGAWDCHFYALNLSDGSLAWKWSNGHPSDKYSPAACWPVAADGKVFFTAPDRVFTALDAASGRVVWRTKQHVVRETVGLSIDGRRLFSRCMWDSVVCMDATASVPRTLWTVNAAYGYDHNPSMLIQLGATVVFGTKNGLLHGIEAATGRVLWRHKLGNSVLNTICPVPCSRAVTASPSASSSPSGSSSPSPVKRARECIVSSADGTLTCVRVP